MPDLRTLLDQAAGNPPDLPDLAAIRERGQALKTRSRLVWGLGAVAASVLLAAGVGVALQQSDRETLPAPRPSQSQTKGLATNTCAVQTSPPRDTIVYSKTKPDGTQALHLMAPDGSADRCLVDTEGPDSWPTWSPDGEWIAFVGGDAEQTDLFIVRADGSGLTRVTDTAQRKSHPVWSPDGRRLGYNASRGEDSPPSIHVVQRDGGGDVVVPSGAGRADLQDWSPDGSTLLYTSGSSEGGDSALWAMAPDGSRQRLLRSEQGDFGSGAQYSPDGTRIAFQADLDGGCIYRSDPNARALTRLTTGCNQGGTLSWSPDGTRIVTAGSDHGPRDAVVLTSEGGDQHSITTGQDASFVDWQPSGTG